MDKGNEEEGWGAAITLADKQTSSARGNSDDEETIVSESR
jgi:hypothetical protein